MCSLPLLGPFRTSDRAGNRESSTHVSVSQLKLTLLQTQLCGPIGTATVVELSTAAQPRSRAWRLLHAALCKARCPEADCHTVMR